MSVPAITRCIAIAIALAGVPALAWCQASSDDIPATTAMARVELEAPRLERSDSAAITPRSLPGYRTDLTEISLQRWATRGRAGVGIGVGSITLTDRPTGLLGGMSADAVPIATAQTLMLGLRYRATDQSTFYADATHVRGLPASDDRLVSKVGMEFKAAQSDWKVALGGFGFRFAGDTRMTLKLRRSGVSVMMKRVF